ncbi:hypothetical protein JXA12_04285 [Candidatus Woesearchaeota archaeon]|nr:hypothetical protein [Candidatus Woesearchaeota archaeon]
MAKKKTSAKQGNDSNLVAVLAYILVGIVWYFADEKAQNKTTKFHVKQAIVLFLLWFICGLILPFIWFFLLWIINLIGVVLVIIGIVHALNNEQKPLPIIGGLAEKLTF